MVAFVPRLKRSHKEEDTYIVFRHGEEKVVLIKEHLLGQVFLEFAGTCIELSDDVRAAIKRIVSK